MPRCKFCKKEIDRLVNFTSGLNRYDFWVDNDMPDYQFDTFIEDNKTNDYECPECQEILFNDEEEATAFLKGQDELQRIVAEKLKQIKEKNKNGSL